MHKIPDDILRRLAFDDFDVLLSRPRAWAYSADVLITAATLLGESIQSKEDRDQSKREAELRKGGPVSGGGRMTAEEFQEMLVGNTVGVWAMLVALAIENLLKGVIAGQGGPRSKEHDLVKLADLANFCRSPGETNVLVDLTEYSVWRGRYLAPTRAEKLFELKKRADVRETAIPLWPIERAWTICNPIIARLSAEIQRLSPLPV